AALFGEYGRRVFEFGAFRPDLGDAGFDGGDLRGRAFPAGLPLVLFGDDRLQPAVRQFRLARQRLRLGAHLGGEPAMALDVAADRGQLRLGVEARRQFVQRRDRGFVRGLRFGAVGIDAAVGFRQRRFARGVTVDLAFGRRVPLARGIGLALRGAPRIARGGLRGGGGFQFGLGGLQRLALGGGIAARQFELVFDVD